MSKLPIFFSTHGYTPKGPMLEFRRHTPCLSHDSHQLPGLQHDKVNQQRYTVEGKSY